MTMQETFCIKKVAVLGAGVMGAQIAGHCVNSGFETLLFDLPAKEGSPNSLVEKAIVNLTKLKPAPLGSSSMASLLQAKNYDHDLEELSSCDLIIEAIAERIDWKEDLYGRISPYLTKDSILVSNTSGLSINTLSEFLPEGRRKNFCGVHFFNPPRYMHLAELIPANSTSTTLLDDLESWLTRYLGKGVVRAKDTPNFIANRIGVFSMLVIMHHTQAMNMGLDEVDALTGPLLGRPKSATFRTMDVVGLDTMVHVVHTMQQQLQEDPWHHLFEIPEWLTTLVNQGHLGQKSGQGIYRKQGKIIEVYDIQTKNYRESHASVSDDLLAIFKISSPVERMKALFNSTNKQAKFISACFRDLFHYCAFHLEMIAETVRDVDLAIKWGFGWQQGPFETWELSGFEDITQALLHAINTNESLAQVHLPAWIYDINAFYTEKGAFCPQNETYKAKSNLPVYQRQLAPAPELHQTVKPMHVLYENDGVKLWSLKDDVSVLSFKSKANTIGQPVIDGLEQALDIAEKQCQGLIIYQQDPNNFCSGADLRAVLEHIKNNKFSAIEEMITQFQRVAMRLKYSSIPTVAALRGRAFGGGCELMMQCSKVVAGFESYPGLVELGVGVIPAGGGCKEMALRAAEQAQQSDLLLFLQPYFQNIAMAKVAGSAIEAQEMGYVRKHDHFVMHADEVLYAALSEIKAMNELNYMPPLKKPIKVAGIEGRARLRAGLVNWLEGGFMSKYDYVLANELAQVLCGGDLYEGTLVDESWFLKLEAEAFVRLVANPETQARISSILETGKPLRN